MDKAEGKRAKKQAQVLNAQIKNIKNLALQLGDPLYISAASELERLQKLDPYKPEIKKRVNDLITKMSK